VTGPEYGRGRLLPGMSVNLHPDSLVDSPVNLSPWLANNNFSSFSIGSIFLGEFGSLVAFLFLTTTTVQFLVALQSHSCNSWQPHLVPFCCASVTCLAPCHAAVCACIALLLTYPYLSLFRSYRPWILTRTMKKPNRNLQARKRGRWLQLSRNNS
jgi:hypothetical protein